MKLDPPDSESLPRFSDQEYERRDQRVRQMMEDEGLERLVIYGNGLSRDDIWHLTNFPPRHDCYLILGPESSATLLVQLFNHVPQAQGISNVADTRWGGADSAAKLVEVLRERKTDGPLGVVGPIPYQAYRFLKEELGDTQIQDASGLYRQLRVVKSSEEIEWLRRGAEFTDLAVSALAETASPGISEYELAASLEAAYTNRGGLHGIHFLATTPMDRPQAYVPAQNPTPRRLKRGDVILSEISAGYWGYSGQILRSFTVGDSANAEYQSLYRVAVEAYEKVAGAIRPGAEVEAVLAAADVIHRAGYTICDDLVHGYGMGYLQPVLRTRETLHRPPARMHFQENMTLVIQPNPVDVEKRMGVQVGNLVRVTPYGVESLQSFPMEFRVCG